MLLHRTVPSKKANAGEVLPDIAKYLTQVKRHFPRVDIANANIQVNYNPPSKDQRLRDMDGGFPRTMAEKSVELYKFLLARFTQLYVAPTESAAVRFEIILILHDKQGPCHNKFQAIPGGAVFEPFAGTAACALACADFGCTYFGTEMNERVALAARARLGAYIAFKAMIQSHAPESQTHCLGNPLAQKTRGDPELNLCADTAAPLLPIDCLPPLPDNDYSFRVCGKPAGKNQNCVVVHGSDCQCNVNPDENFQVEEMKEQCQKLYIAKSRLEVMVAYILFIFSFYFSPYV